MPKRIRELLERVSNCDTSAEPAITPPTKKPRWTNKQRVMVLASRGITARGRHLMNDLKRLMPHSKSESKFDEKHKLSQINEICEMRNCNKCIYIEGKKKKDVYMWVSCLPNGPSAKFLVENIHTTEELKLTGNCLKSSRPILSFNSEFDSLPHWRLLKEVFTQTLGTPLGHPKSQPFVDHCFSLTVIDSRIWFRNYQIVDSAGQLAEIGPRFVLNPLRLFDGSFSGATLWENTKYQSPNLLRSLSKKDKGLKFVSKLQSRKAKSIRDGDIGDVCVVDQSDSVFNTEQL